MNRSIKILFLAANPKDTSALRLYEEIRGIDQALHQAEFRDKFDIKQQWAVRIADLQGYLLRHKPDIVHFSGHGSASSEIILEDNEGYSRPVSACALGQLFSLLNENIRCVVLNACYSEQQAQAIAKNIDCVVGMSKAIGDSAAISFAIAFYQALGYGKDIKTAFDLGCLQIDLENLNEQDTPKLIAVNSDPKKIVFAHKKLAFNKHRKMKDKAARDKSSETALKDKDHSAKRRIKITAILSAVIIIIGALADWIEVSNYLGIDFIKKSSQNSKDLPKRDDKSDTDAKERATARGTSVEKPKFNKIFYQVTLIIPSAMSEAEIFVDDKPATIVDRKPTIITIRVEAKEANHQVTVKQGDRSCTKSLFIDRNNLILQPCQ